VNHVNEARVNAKEHNDYEDDEDEDDDNDLTMMVSEVFMPCSRMATRVKTSIMGPYSSPATFCTPHR